MEKESRLLSLCSREHIIMLLYAAVFLIPVAQELLYVPLTLAVLASVARAVKRKQIEWRAGPLWKAGAGFLVLSFLSILNSPDKVFSLFNWVFLPFHYAALYVLIMTYADDRNVQKNMIKIFFLSGIAVVLYGFWQYAHEADMAAQMAGENWVDTKRFPQLYRRLYSTLRNPNLCATYLLMTTSLAGAFTLLSRTTREKACFAGLTLLFMVALALTYSRGAWIALCFVALVYTIGYDKRIGLVFLFIPVFLCFYEGQLTERFFSLFSGKDTSIGMRFNLWIYTLRMIRDHFLLGSGWGAFFLVYPHYDPYVGAAGVTIFHSHNMYLGIAAETGIPAALCYFAFFFGHAPIGWRLAHAEDPLTRAMGLGGLAALAATAVDGIGDYTLFNHSVSLCFWGLMAMMAILDERTHSLSGK